MRSIVPTNLATAQNCISIRASRVISSLARGTDNVQNSYSPSCKISLIDKKCTEIYPRSPKLMRILRGATKWRATNTKR